ncbi:MAG: CBS domain-containing protein [Candidatus Eisenbacteria sp.]|nr:CBS domain-containing protein [Candidatus Eisenbacteria bacterium]
MTKVHELLDAKGRSIWTVAPETSVFDALQLMSEKQIGAVLVVESRKLVGVFSERDYARKIVLKGKSSKSATVQEMMTKRIFFVSPEETLATCMKLMTAQHVRHLPVLDGDRLVGIITIGDVVKQVISDQQFTIDELTKYITGDGYV